MPALRNSVELTQVIEWEDGHSKRVEDYLAAEEPLEIRVDGRPLTVTMRTPGDDRELAVGFLWTEGLIEALEQIVTLGQDESETGAKSNRIEVELQEGAFEPVEMQRNFFAASSCGICGKASIEAIRNRGLHAPNREFRISPEILCALPDRLRGQQQVFGRTGGMHAAALFNAEGELIQLREDIGRHNAVDKVVGWALLAGLLPLAQHVLMVSGRGGFEIVQKAIAAGIPAVASVSAPSSLAVKLARELNLTLVGFLRGRRFIIYAGHERCLLSTR
ncbi:MAG TPA: formate dehydrogenase accessory sulfurtransferase FdhD [Terracidiphilus sp.]|nr:formate dehydrogenase accessory sulfurtransferase FdhD [Terracidiphilus sp.]